jgi:hypothetical protein
MARFRVPEFPDAVEDFFNPLQLSRDLLLASAIFLFERFANDLRHALAELLGEISGQSDCALIFDVELNAHFYLRTSYIYLGLPGCKATA